VRHGGHYRLCATDHRAGQFTFRIGIERKIEQHDGIGDGPIAQDACGHREEPRAIGRRGAIEAGFDPLQQIREIRSGQRQALDLAATEMREP
jgi:hypothetical protein